MIASLRTIGLWRVLTLLAIVFAAGISGTWLGGQMSSPLPFAWGWLGALLAGVAVYGGVELAVAGNWRGYVIALAGVAADVAFAFQFFDDKAHAPWLAWVLALFPPAIAVMAGWVHASTEALSEAQEKQALSEARQQQIEDEERRRKQRIEDEERAWKRQQEAEALRLEAEERRLRIEKNAEIARFKAEAEAQPTRPESASQSASESASRSGKEIAFELLGESEDISNQALAEAAGVSESAARSYRSQWRAMMQEPVLNGNGHHKEER